MVSGGGGTLIQAPFGTGRGSRLPRLGTLEEHAPCSPKNAVRAQHRIDGRARELDGSPARLDQFRTRRPIRHTLSHQSHTPPPALTLRLLCLRLLQQPHTSGLAAPTRPTVVDDTA